MSDREDQGSPRLSRRGFVKAAGVVVATAGTGALAASWAAEGRTGNGLTKEAIPPSQGYLLVDTWKCAGCDSCMLACSLVHHGRESLSLSRIQIEQSSYAHFPDDVVQQQCRQCVFPPCVEACPTGALHVDGAHGNIRTVDKAKCIGCERCVEACPYTPARAIWNFEDRYAEKCDLCADAPYWDEVGGPGGKQACVEVCPMRAIAFTSDIPTQRGEIGYQVNLRREPWKHLGLPTS